MKVVFLDIDGVLNGHQRHGNGYCGIDPAKMQLLNRIIEATNARLVLSSAWRYMIHGGAMRTLGFRYLLDIHGLTGAAVLLGATATDEVCPGRVEQIRRWLSRSPEVTHHCILDDDPGGEFPADLPQLVRTNGAVGLTEADVAKAIAILNARE